MVSPVEAVIVAIHRNEAPQTMLEVLCHGSQGNGSKIIFIVSKPFNNQF